MQVAHQKFIDQVIRLFEAQPSELVHITEALGRVIAGDVRARYTSPHVDMSAINGYAMLCKDGSAVPAVLRLIGESRAGSPFKEELESGYAVKVYAGSPIPLGADTVISLQEAEKKGDAITIRNPVMQGQNICYTGVDFARNEPVLKSGYIISPRDIGLAAAMRTSWVHVRRRPRVGIFAIGDELAMIGDEHEGQKITSSSSMIVSAMIEACGAKPINLGVASDTEISVQKHMEMAAGVDLIVTTGGVSASADDLLKKTLDKKGHHIETKLELSSTISLLLGEKNGTPIFALPGNPISAKICATLFLRPILQKMIGIDHSLSKPSFALLDRDLDVNDLQMHYIFSRLTEDESKRVKALPASSYDRLLMSALAQSDCLVTVDKENCKKGSSVEIRRFANNITAG